MDVQETKSLANLASEEADDALLETRTGRSELRRTLAFATVLIAFVLEVADSTIVNTALPAIRSALAASDAQMQWIVAAYFLSLGALLLIGGRLGDMYGYRRMFLIGIAAFVLASAFCGLSRTGGELVAARLLQGAAGAVMAPQMMAIVQILYDPLERIGRLAWFGLVGGLAAILGPILGGALIAVDALGLGWRTIFFINLPVGLVALLAGRAFIPDVRSTLPLRVDVGGAALFALASATVLAVLIQGPALAWPIWCLAALAAGFGLYAWGWVHAVRRVARMGSAVIEPALFRLPTFSWGLAVVTVFAASSAGFLLVLAVALQQGAGLSPLQTALRHMPFGLGVMAGISVIGRRYLARFGKWLLVVGTTVMALATSLSLLLIAGGYAGSPMLVATLFVAGLGMGTTAGPLAPIVVSGVDVAHAGTASATLKAVQQIGGAVGIAGIGGVYLKNAGIDAPSYLAALPDAIVAIVFMLLAAVLCAFRLPVNIFVHSAAALETAP